MTAAIYAIRKRLNVLLVSRDLGGKTQYRLALPWIEDYQVIRGLEIVNKFKSELEYLEFARHMEPVDNILPREDVFAVVPRSGVELVTRAVIIATGSRQQFMEVPGEKEFIMHGLCYSALSYAPLFIDRTVVVIGDGELALRSAAELATVAKHVHIICSCGQFPESPLAQKLRLAGHVTPLFDQQVVEVLGDQYARTIVLKNPAGEQVEIDADAFFVERALIPNSKMAAELVDLDEHGRIKVDINNCTNVPGIFAAGDVTNSFAEQVLVAVGEGAKAALSAYDYLLPCL